jgi:hypothetical protein
MNRSRSFAAGLFLALLAGPVSAAPLPNTKPEYEPPTATFQMLAGQKLFLEAALYCSNVFDKETNEKIAERMKALSGDKLLGGLDTSRPAAAYLYLKPKIEQSAWVFVVPITDEKAALESLAAMGLDVAKENKAANLYTLTELVVNRWNPFAFLNGVAPVLRFHDKCAYIAFHGESTDLLGKAEKLIPLKDLVNPRETAAVAGTFHIERFPKDLHQPMFDLLAQAQQSVAQLQQQPPPDMPKGFPACAQQSLVWCQRNLTDMLAHGETLTAKFELDGKAGDHDFHLFLTPRAKTTLAADIAAVKKANGRFAQLLAKDAAAGISATLPGPIPAEIRTTAGVFLGDWFTLEFGRGMGLFGSEVPLAEMVNKQVAAGQVDLAGAVYGPGKDERYTAVAAVAIADAPGTEKALRAAFKDAPREVADRIRWDALRIGETKGHTVEVMEAMPEGFRKAFGEKSKLHVVFTKDAAYAAVGPDAAARIEKAMALKPADAPAFNMVVHKEKFKPFGAVLVGQDFPMPLAAKDELVPVYRFDAYGGEALHLKMHLGMVLFAAGVR